MIIGYQPSSSTVHAKLANIKFASFDGTELRYAGAVRTGLTAHRTGIDEWYEVFEVARADELHRLAALLRMIGDTAKLVAKRCPDADNLDINAVASEIANLADKIEGLRGA